MEWKSISVAFDQVEEVVREERRRTGRGSGRLRRDSRSGRGRGTSGRIEGGGSAQVLVGECRGTVVDEATQYRSPDGPRRQRARCENGSLPTLTFSTNVLIPS